MVRIANLLLRFFELAFSLTIIGLVADLIHTQHFGASPGITKYALACAIWGTLVALVGIVDALSSLFRIIVMTVLDGLAALLFLIAGIVMALRLHTGSCSRQSNGAPSDYTTHNYLMNGGSILDPYENTVVWLGTNFPKRCREVEAVTVFLFLAFLLFLISFILDILDRRDNDNRLPYIGSPDLPPPVTGLPPSVGRNPFAPMDGVQRQPWV